MSSRPKRKAAPQSLKLDWGVSDASDASASLSDPERVVDESDSDSGDDSLGEFEDPEDGACDSGESDAEKCDRKAASSVIKLGPPSAGEAPPGQVRVVVTHKSGGTTTRVVCLVPEEAVRCGQTPVLDEFVKSPDEDVAKFMRERLAMGDVSLVPTRPASPPDNVMRLLLVPHEESGISRFQARLTVVDKSGAKKNYDATRPLNLSRAQRHFLSAVKALEITGALLVTTKLDADEPVVKKHKFKSVEARGVFETSSLPLMITKFKKHWRPFRIKVEHVA